MSHKPSGCVKLRYTYLWTAKNLGYDQTFYKDASKTETITAYKFTLQDGNDVYVGEDGVIYEIIYHSIDGKSIIKFYKDL